MRRNNGTVPINILSEQQYRSCRLCPRQCGADRTKDADRTGASEQGSGNEQPRRTNRAGDTQLPPETPETKKRGNTDRAGDPADSPARMGYCRCSDRIKVARAALHMWEEPCISGPAAAGGPISTSGSPRTGRPQTEPSAPAVGSGTVFFSGCTLGCRFCQNYAISHEHFGKEISVRELADIFLRLQDKGALNINLVTATQYLPSVVRALDLVRERLRIPVVYNCGGYERPEIVRALSGYVDIWLPDLKYLDSSLASLCSRAGDYFTYASQAIPQMIAQTGPPVLDSRGILRSGVIVRHMVLPGARQDSIRLLHWMKENLPAGGYLLSLLSQYTPAGEFAPCGHIAASRTPSPKDRRATSQGPSSAGERDVSRKAPHEDHLHTPQGFSAEQCAGTRKSSHEGHLVTPQAPSSIEQRAGAPQGTSSAAHLHLDLTRRVTTFEYESVLSAAIDLGLTSGYMQQKCSAKKEYTPPFDLEGV